jgi:hypothetical protein
VDHISAKHRLTWCCLQCCMIGASNSMVTIELIEGGNQIEYLLVLLNVTYQDLLEISFTFKPIRNKDIH